MVFIEFTRGKNFPFDFFVYPLSFRDVKNIEMIIQPAGFFFFAVKALFPSFSLFLRNLSRTECIFIFLRYCCSDGKYITRDNVTCRGIRNKKSTKDSEVLAEGLAQESP